MAVAALCAAHASVSAQPDVVPEAGEGVPPAGEYGANHSLEELPAPDSRAVELPAPDAELPPVAELPAPPAPETELLPADELRATVGRHDFSRGNDLGRHHE